ncbi:hypothetical protein HBH1_01855 [Herbaspirillum sp. BH-1]|uniref:Uncharacterized protein n=1 Tax=Herbaspirillum frisingense TaxID=92645 RepID=A0ABU1P9I0_9BURK|nr:hypothetical protein [Herbaspirillum frisingense]PLY59926.1 hypothetical protein HBH1_01855 [Herbaspirillum sp. BH-1]
MSDRKPKTAIAIVAAIAVVALIGGVSLLGMFQAAGHS